MVQNRVFHGLQSLTTVKLVARTVKLVKMNNNYYLYFMK